MDSRPVYQQYGQSFTDTSTTQPSFDLNMYDVSSRDALASSSIEDINNCDHYNDHSHQPFKETQLHNAGIGYYTDPLWAYM
jgi:hypothetical protein